MATNSFNDQHLLVLIGVRDKKSYRKIAETIPSANPKGHVSLGWVQTLVRDLLNMGHIRKVEVKMRNDSPLRLNASGIDILKKENLYD